MYTSILDYQTLQSTPLEDKWNYFDIEIRIFTIQ